LSVQLPTQLVIRRTREKLDVMLQTLLITVVVLLTT
jgi:hypothetical protein